jgi:hypothetical protein
MKKTANKPKRKIFLMFCLQRSISDQMLSSSDGNGSEEEKHPPKRL